MKFPEKGPGRQRHSAFGQRAVVALRGDAAGYRQSVSLYRPPLPVRWSGGCMLIDALHRHRPNPRVGRNTQQAAYRFQGVIGAIIPIGTFFPGRSIGLAVIVPRSIRAIVPIGRDDRPDIQRPAEPTVEESAHGH